MATYDEWRKGFCCDGGMDVCITANELFQRRSSEIKKIAVEYICNVYDKCIHYNQCKYSGGCGTQKTLTPTII